jgi:hypothetical protein
MTDFSNFNPNNPLNTGLGVSKSKNKKVDASQDAVLPGNIETNTTAQNASLKSPDSVFNFISQQSQGVGQSIRTDQMMSHFDKVYQNASQQISDQYQKEFGKPVPENMLPLMVDRYLNNKSDVVIQA